MKPTSEEVLEYYAATENREIRDDLVFATGLVKDKKIAIDCGCGAGADIAYLRDQGFIVHAFDIEEDAIKRCKERFNHDAHVALTQASFDTYNYPQANLIAADASLFFCPETAFESVWRKMHKALLPQGILCASFLGPEDSMASPGYNGDAYWPNVLVFNEAELRSHLCRFSILRFTEHKVSGTSPTGENHQWHIFSVVAQKKT